jgi:vanillate O-demethylase ferredoxin subunit
MTAFCDELAVASFASRVTFHHDGGDPGKGLDVRALLASVPDGLHVYCCGPAGLMQAVERATSHWPSGRVHFEYFSGTEDAAAPHTGDQPFEVVIASTGQTMVVPVGRTILEVLRDHGIIVESLCREGICGTCITKVLDGTPDHRDLVLDDTEKSENKLITVCCSRAQSTKLVLDL